MSVLQRIQNWYIINCDGDWEHESGLSLSTLDNPGWHLIINLRATALENLQYNRQYQNEAFEHDWFHVKAEEQNLEIYCGPNNLEKTLLIFLDEIIPTYADPSFVYNVYLPVLGRNYGIWFPAKAKLLSESSLELLEVPEAKYEELALQDLDLLDFSRENMPVFKHSYVVGERVKIALEQMFDGVKLVAAK